MTALEAAILGIVQGLTEFLPVSSSGHLVLVPDLLGIPPPPLAFDVLLHLATLAAVVGYFIRDLRDIVLSFVAPHRLPAVKVKTSRRMGLWLLVGSIPAGLAGLLLRDFVESLFGSTLAVGAFLIITGFIMWAAHMLEQRVEAIRDIRSMRASDAIVVGIFQSLALAPGISRSGATISGAMFLGFHRAQAARFSFLLGIPAILGAGLVEMRGLAEGATGGDAGMYVAGGLAGFVSGLFAVHFLLRFLQSHHLRPFFIYVWVLGALVVAVALI